MITLEIKNTALKTLPKSPGVYFVMEDQKCLYVGKSKSLFNRWNLGKHHREAQIKADHPIATLTYLSFDEKLLSHWEDHYIQLLKPSLNRTRIKKYASIEIPDRAQKFLSSLTDFQREAIELSVTKILIGSEGFCFHVLTKQDIDTMIDFVFYDLAKLAYTEGFEFTQICRLGAKYPVKIYAYQDKQSSIADGDKN